MPSSVLKLLVPLAVLVVLWFAVFKSRPPAAQEIAKTGGPADPSRLDPSRFLIRPFYSQGAQTALALDGGALTAAGGQVPSVVIGDNILRTVHLAWLHDWSREDCRKTFARLHDLLASEEGKSLPALRIHLNPVFSDAAGEGLHRAMLQVYFRADDRHLYQTLAKELGAGTLAATAEAVRARVETLEPLLLTDWDTNLDWLENDIGKTFSAARVQQARNSAILGEGDANRLTSMLATLPALADQGQLIDFLRNADASQRTWLQQNPAAGPDSAPAR